MVENLNILSNLKRPRGKKKGKRLGRGVGSGKGGTCGRGTKGLKARSGGGKPPWFEGGQTPLYRRIPKRGFKNISHIEYQVVNVKDLNRFEPNSEVTPEILKKYNLARRNLPVKILGDGEIDRPLTVKAHAFSKTAKEKIEKAGGKVEIIPL